MDEGQRLLAEALGHGPVLHAVLVEMLRPECEGADRDGVDGAVDLSRAASPLEAGLLERERRHHRAHLGVLVGVVEVVDRRGAVEEHRLLDHPLADDLGEEIDVFLRRRRAAGDVMDSVNASSQLSLPRSSVRRHRPDEFSVPLRSVLSCVHKLDRSKAAFDYRTFVRYPTSVREVLLSVNGG